MTIKCYFVHYKINIAKLVNTQKIHNLVSNYIYNIRVWASFQNKIWGGGGGGGISNWNSLLS